MRTVGIITTSRADFGSYRPILRELKDDPELKYRLMVSGTHLSPNHGLTVREIEAEGYVIEDRVEATVTCSTPQGIVNSMGLALIGFSQVFAQHRPDILLIEGDRFEMLAAALAAVPYGIPIAHLGGGDVTVGAIDDVFRHSLTKISHLHFVALEAHRQRVIRLGEEPWRVRVTGEPSLDNLKTTKLLSRDQLDKQYGFRIPEPFLLATYHPVTMEPNRALHHVKEFLRALADCNLPVVFTMPNADHENAIIREQIRTFVATHPDSWVFESFGVGTYFSLMALAGAMVGNSSSGILEAASFNLPVVNIGIRQQGRFRAENVIDVPDEWEAIVAGIHRATSESFRNSFRTLINPYGDGCATERILRTLRSVPIDDTLVRKRFYEGPDLPTGSCF